MPAGERGLAQRIGAILSLDPSANALEFEQADGVKRFDHGFPAGMRSAWATASLGVFEEAGWEWVHERAATVLDEVPLLIEAGDIEAAENKLAEVAALEPGNRGARQYRKIVQDEKERRKVAARLPALLEESDAHLRARHVRLAHIFDVRSRYTIPRHALVMCGSGRRGVDFSPAMLPAGAGSMGAILAI